MAPADWERVKSVFAASLGIAPGERAAFLEAQCSGVPGLRREVESLLAANSGAGDFLVEPAVAWRDEPVAPASRDLLGAGAKLGAYTVIQKIDEGGMAVVYQAVRDDGEFRKLVAVKVLKPGMDTHFVLERFQNEKQILAHFDHPNIAKLLDSGSTPGGRPYFVLEFIAGRPIDIYCMENTLSIKDRLKLFQKICSAVEYAHQNLIVHRDLKPRNILVTASGDPRLLDFGIAKILSDERELTVTGVRPMTPEYASPEQIRGEPVTTATDIYGLGVVLYELLTGCRPFRSPTGSMHDLARMITEGSPRRPSTQAEADARHWARRLRGDLDNIVLKAMHADPHRRYRSVGELAADIDRYFAGEPVLAAGDEWAYRAGKFVGRHRGGVIAGSLAFLSLAAGLAVATHEATVARRERTVSDRHAAEVRRLANSLIFDLHDAIVNLPGATPVRAKLMGRATEALDSLRSSAGGNVAIQRELAAAYERLADVQGGPQEFNLGELAASLKNYQNALTLLEQVRKSSPGDLSAARSMAGIEWMVSTIFERQGDVKGAASMAQKALDLREFLARAEPRKAQAKRDLAMAYYLRGNTAVTAGDLATARTVRRKALALWESIAADEPDDPKAGYQIALAAKMLAAVEQVFHDYGSAARHLERAHAIDRERVRLAPRDASARLDVSFDLSELAGLSLQTGNPAQAAKYYVEARKIREDLLAHDAANERLQNRVAYIRSREGRVHLQLGNLKDARAAFVRALDIRQKIASDRTNITAQLDLAESQGDLGAWSCTAGDRPGGKALLRRALAGIDEIDRRSPLDFETRQEVDETRRQLSVCE